MRSGTRRVRETTARRSPRQVSLRVPRFAGHPAAFMDMPEAAPAGGPPATSVGGLRCELVISCSEKVCLEAALEAVERGG